MPRTGFPDPDLFDQFAHMGRRLSRTSVIDAELPYATPLSCSGSLRRILVILSRCQHGPDRSRILFASAMATNILGFLANIPDSQDLFGIVLRPSQFKRDIALMIKSRRISACPAFDIRPSRSFPPAECRRRTRPSQAAKSRPRRKLSMGGANASTAIALIGPMPGIVCKRRAVSVSDARAQICFVFLSIRCVFSAIYGRRSRHSSRTSSGKSLFSVSTIASIRVSCPGGIGCPNS